MIDVVALGELLIADAAKLRAAYAQGATAEQLEAAEYLLRG